MKNRIFLSAGLLLSSLIAQAEPLPAAAPLSDISNYQLPSDAINIVILRTSAQHLKSSTYQAPGGPGNQEPGDRVSYDYDRGNTHFHEVWEFRRSEQDYVGNWVRIEYSERENPSRGSSGGNAGNSSSSGNDASGVVNCNGVNTCSTGTHIKPK